MDRYRYRAQLGLILAVFMLIIVGAQNTRICEANKLRVAIVEFDVKGELEIKDAGEIIPEMLVTALGSINSFDLKERVLMKRILKEQSLALTGVIDQHSAAEIGRIFGVEAVVTGSVVKWGKTIQVNARLIDTRDGTVVRTASIDATNVDEIPGKIHRLAEQFVKTGSSGATQEISSKAPVDAITEDKQAQPRVSEPAKASQQNELYVGTWVLRTSHSGLRELNYSKLVLKQNQNQITGILHLPNGGKVQVAGTVSGETLSLYFYFKDDKSLETGLTMHGIERITALDINNMRAGIGRSEMRAIAEISGSGTMLEGTFQMWHAEIRPYVYQFLASVGSVNIYDAGSTTAREKRPPGPIRLIFMEK